MKEKSKIHEDMLMEEKIFAERGKRVKTSGSAHTPEATKKILHYQLLPLFILGSFLLLLMLYVNPSNTGNTGSISMKNLHKPAKNNIIVLIWFWPFGSTFELTTCESEFNIHDCYLTADRNLYNKSHAVLIHQGDIKKNSMNLPTQPRPFFQKWVWMNMESPSNIKINIGLYHLFNLTLTYRRDSDIQVPYGSLTMSKAPLDFAFPNKQYLVCWVVSNWNSNHARVKYYYELQKYIKINTYGGLNWNHLSNEDLIPTISGCKFYLSFENSVHEDYITEKLYNALLAGTVPVVLGPPRKNYENYIPADSFIHVDDFHSANELADYLHVLDDNKDLYMHYFEWRVKYTVRMTHFWDEPACKVCENIKRYQDYKSYSSLEKWSGD
ncbi:4-galactosyl-N-acetylglucosaminide 3-alpha-L-fucosyltransferase 9-like isoform X2 [Scyliorhinus canicula]|uniref:4-galactosyl-N-acetylglucosaminide 3-alpha-L-fucosyltransferase 9-like isoform X2 n=1 Tax=Scyliorhinus canicula TaxID=7830 RepID=UPI0018F79D58|nr:4-galactosyl-N-acetylglucosaminide 3-alpha-L-fucosyltransferase 9-like isoform X2 [Scyliorhinus canicula]